MTGTLEPGSVLPAAAGVAACQDCGAPISGNYCSNCGQETRIEVPSVRQFAHELMDQYIAVEGKLGRTLRVLLSQPGQLTLDYVQGRRQRYVRPLKLYVSVSVVFFGLLGLLPDSIGNPFMKTDAAEAQQPAATIGQPDTSGPAADAPAASPAQPAAASAPAEAAAPAPVPTPAPSATPAPPAAPYSIGGDLKQMIQKEIDADLKKDEEAHTASTIERQVDAEVKQRFAKDRHAKKDQAGLSSPEERRQLREKLADDAPYAMFFLLPYFAFLLRWLYRKNRQRYGVHLLFTVHLHCFFFILLMLMFLPFSPLRKLLELAGAAYTFLALRHVYGGSWARTLWRMTVLAFFDMLAVSATALSGVMSAVFHFGT